MKLKSLQGEHTHRREKIQLLIKSPSLCRTHKEQQEISKQTINLTKLE